MDCKEAQLLTVPYILGDLDPDSRQCRELEAHLLSCQACAEEYENSKCVVEFIQEHKVLFAEAFETIDKKRAAEQEEIKRSWQAIQANLHTTLWKVTAAAACVIIGISAWLMLSNSKTLQKPTPQQIALAPTPSIKIELLSDNGNIITPAGTEIKTATNELKILIINGKHRMVLNSDTSLSIELLLDYERVGCMVKLASGEIFTHVRHDGNPFVVATGQGSALIIGTVFDIKTTDISTTLVVAEGTVQFESEEGFVEVAAGYTSEIAGQSAPTKPATCNTAELTAWATGHELKTALAKIGSLSLSDAYDLTDLWLSAMSGSINLEDIDYEGWIEEKRGWFKREFPWIFQLRDALAKEGIEVDYPELLISSGDIWQFVYPGTSLQQIPILYFDPLLKTASKYGFDKQWLMANITATKFAIDKPAAAKGRFSGLKAFEEWASCFEQVRKSPEELDSGTLLCSLHAGTYLANTRTLAWFSINDGKHLFRPEDKTVVLALLQTEVNTANKLTGKIIELLRMSQSEPCGECQGLVDKVVEDISAIMSSEKGILKYEGRE
ncbi:MAG: FecR domain-containing protein [Sedimentisphaerales bacterium]